MTPTTLPDDFRPLWARASLRRNLPGDGTPVDHAEAARRCPHTVLRHKIISASRHRHAVNSWTEPDMFTHRCFGGFLLRASN